MSINTEKVDVYKLFIASPGDTKGERDIIERIAEDISNTVGSQQGFRIKTLRWENDVVPNVGAYPQNVINDGIGKDYHLFIGIMWKRFGEKTPNADSGTEEEFQIAYENKNKIRIMFYFNDENIPQSDIDSPDKIEQYSKVLEFKKRIAELGTFYHKYKSKDDFERHVRNHITISIMELHKRKSSDVNIPYQIPIHAEINPEFLNYLNDMEVAFSHGEVDSIFLDDIYVFPDLDVVDQRPFKRNEIKKSINLSEIIGEIDVNGVKTVYVGDEKSGKTAACKVIYKQYYNYGMYPILINGTDISTNIRQDAINKIIEKFGNHQYGGTLDIKKVSPEKILIIIDDFHKSSKGNSKYWTTITKNLSKAYRNIVLSGSPLMQMDSTSDFRAFDDFTVHSISEFGPKLRNELIKKWVLLGVDQKFVDKNSLLKKRDDAHAFVKAIMGKGYIPSTPFYLISILQAMEMGTPQNSNYSIHGFYYEMLINDSLRINIKNQEDISLYSNLLTHFCFYLFENKKKSIDVSEFEKFYFSYAENHKIPEKYTSKVVMKALDSAKLLLINGRVCPKESYVYYFFTAKYITNHINKREHEYYIKQIIRKMIQRIFRDEYSSIVMFLTHLSKDEFIIDELLNNANDIFRDSKAARLDSDVDEINRLIKTLPAQVMELVDVNIKRDEEIDEEDRVEKNEKEFDDETINYDTFDLDEDVQVIDIYAKMTLAIKTIDILGQVAKKHWGELSGGQKFDIIKSTYDLGRRLLGFYFDFIVSRSGELAKYIGNLIQKKHVKDRFPITKEEIESSANEVIFKLCFLATFGITKRISYSISFENLKASFEDVLKIDFCNSVKLIDLAIQLSTPGLPIDVFEEYKRDMGKNNLGYLMLQNLFIDHIYMFETEHTQKAKMCSLLEISIQRQELIDRLSKVKK